MFDETSKHVWLGFPRKASVWLTSQPGRRIVLAALSLYPLVLVLVSGRQGPGVWSDSVNYAFAAKSLAETGEVLGWSGDHLTLWPPGLPVLLGSLVRLGVSLEAAAVGLNAFCAAASVLLTYLLSLIALRSILLSLVAAAVVSMSASTIRVFTLLASEPLFVVLTLVALVVGTRAVATQRFHLPQSLALSLVVSVATTIRYAGAWLIPFASLAAVFALWREGRGRAVLMALLTSGLSSLGLLAIAWRNVSLGEPPLGERSPSLLSAPSIVTGSAATVGRYVTPFSWTLAAVVVGLLIFCLLGYALVVSFRQRSLAVLNLAIFVALYWMLFTYSQLAASTSPTNARFTSPVFTPMVVLTIYALRDIWSRKLRLLVQCDERRFPRRALVLLPRMLLSLLLIASASEGLHYVAEASTNGIGYNTTDSRMSPLTQSLIRIPAGSTIVATDDAKAAWVSQRRGIERIPRRTGSISDSSFEKTTMDFVDRVNNGSWDYLAFFADADISSLSPAEMVQKGARIHLVANYPDGTLWCFGGPHCFQPPELTNSEPSP